MRIEEFEIFYLTEKLIVYRKFGQLFFGTLYEDALDNIQVESKKLVIPNL